VVQGARGAASASAAGADHLRPVAARRALALRAVAERAAGRRADRTPGAPASRDPRRRFRTRAVVLGWLGGIAVGIALTVALALLILGSPCEPPGAIVARHSGIVSVESASKRGDCLVGVPEEADVTSRADVTGCEARHGSEVLGVVTLPEVDDPPHESDADFFADDACRTAFRDYIGQSWEDSDLDTGAVAPTPGAWRAGDRTLFCLLDSHTFQDGRGSAGNSAA
jgi:Septum formation